VDYIIDQFAFKANEKNLELLANVEKTIPNILIGDEGRLVQIIINLIGNSIKFTHVGEIVFKIEVIKHIGNEITLHFIVEDSGIGISPSRIDKIFESFTQADGSTTRKYGGTGLGTSISKMLIDLMDGEIWVESPNPNFAWSVDNPGSVFHFTLPFQIDKTQSDDILSNENFQTLNALLIDSNQTGALLLKKTLLNWGLKTVETCDEKEMLDFIQNKPNVNFMLIDYQIIKQNTETFILDIKKRNPNLKTILMIAGNSSADINLNNSFDKIIHKPIKYSVLFENINDLFFNKKSEEKSIDTKENRIKRILLVEDNLINQKIAEKMLSNIGYESIIANNGQEAIDIVTEQKEQFDMILMDVQMPVMSGLEATKLLRENGFSLPVIAMTANVLKGDKEICFEAGMNDFIGKPVKFDELEKMLQKWS
jgi:CheY-like chemotaxis protein